MSLSVLPANMYSNASVLNNLSDWEIQEFMPELKLTKYIPYQPTEKQEAALLMDDVTELLYGGAAGGGKSDFLLMAALQYVDVPGYAALLVRRTFADLSQPGALIPRSHAWLRPWQARGECQWRGDLKQWDFPSGAKIKFGYLDNDKDIFKYQSTEFQFVGFDELTQIPLEEWYTYLFSRMRHTKDIDVPLRMRGATNPGGIGEDWVKRRFIDSPWDMETGERRIFLLAVLEDNPHLDTEEYDKSLKRTSPTTYQQLRRGIWGVKTPGEFFRASDFQIIDTAPPGCSWIRSWDLAATESKTAAYTAGAKMAIKDDRLYISNMVRFKGDPGVVETNVVNTAKLDGRGTRIYIEQEGGSGGKNTLYRYTRSLLLGWSVEPFAPRQDKLTRATPLSGLTKAKGVYLVSGDDPYWIRPFLVETEAFPNGFKDQVDCCSAGYQILTDHDTPGFRRL